MSSSRNKDTLARSESDLANRSTSFWFWRSITKILSYFSKRVSVKCCARCVDRSTPYFLAIATDLRSGACPTCQSPVPADSMTQLRPRSAAICFKIPCANGERQMFPKHTIKILMLKNLFIMIKQSLKLIEKLAILEHPYVNLAAQRVRKLTLRRFKNRAYSNRHSLFRS